MTETLQGRVALITGGTSGIGLATAKGFAAEGARVAVCGRDPNGVAQARAALGDRHLALCCDVTDVKQIEQMVAIVRQQLGKIDICFANAGITVYKPLHAWAPEDFDHQIAINLRGQFFTVQKTVPAMNDGGVVILTGSIAARLGQPEMAAYAASKAAAPVLARNISADLLHRNIRVLCLTPGPVDTPIFEKGGLTPNAAAAKLVEVSRRVPIGRAGQADELASVALFLASDASSFMLGAEIVVDGGKSQL